MKTIKYIGVIALLVLLVPAILLLLLDPYFFYIDSCLDLGGRWNYEIQDCEGSEAYIAWQERTIW